PVGSIVVLGVNTNPNSLYGFGTWTRIQGRMIVGVSDTDNDFDLDDTGGAKTHTLTISEMPSHNHTVSYQYPFAAGGNGIFVPATTATTPTGQTPATVQNTGGGQPHNHMPPFIAKYIWQR